MEGLYEQEREKDLRKARGFIHCAFAARDAGIPEGELLGDAMWYMRGKINPSDVVSLIREARAIFATIPRY
jgi:hypothetical protein